MPYTITYRNQLISNELNNFLFYMPFTLAGPGSINLITGRGTGCYLAVLMDGRPTSRRPAEPEAKGGGVAMDHLTIASTDVNVGTLVFDHMTLVNQVKIERENEWSEIRIYHGDVARNGTFNWISTTQWNKGPTAPNQIASNCTKTFSFGAILNAPCDETVVVGNDRGKPQSVTLCRRLIAGTIAEEIMSRGSIKAGGGQLIPILTLKTQGNSDDVETVPDRTFFNNSTPRGNRSGYVLIAAGAFAYQSADTMLEEWRSASGLGLDLGDVRRRLGRIAFAPENVVFNGNRLLRKLHNVDSDHVDGVTTGRNIDDAPVEVLFVAADMAGDVT